MSKKNSNYRIAGPFVLIIADHCFPPLTRLACRTCVSEVEAHRTAQRLVEEAA